MLAFSKNVAVHPKIIYIFTFWAKNGHWLDANVCNRAEECEVNLFLFQISFLFLFASTFHELTFEAKAEFKKTKITTMKMHSLEHYQDEFQGNQK